MARPNARQFSEAVKAKTGQELDPYTVSDLLYGTIGSNVDTRDWSSIMNSSDPVAATREATRQYYERGPVRREKTPEQKMREIQADARTAQNRRQQVMEMILSGQAADSPTAYGFTQQQVDEARRSQNSNQGLRSFIQQQGTGAFAPAEREEFTRRVSEIKNPTTVQYTNRVPGTPIAQSVDDPDDPNSQVRNSIVASDGSRVTGFSPTRIQNFGYDPYTLQPMYTSQQNPNTGQASLTPAFDTATLGYDFGGIDPYSQEGLQAYYGVPLQAAEVPTQNALRTQTYDILGDIMNRMGYSYEPYDYSYAVK